MEPQGYTYLDKWTQVLARDKHSRLCDKGSLLAVIFLGWDRAFPSRDLEESYGLGKGPSIAPHFLSLTLPGSWVRECLQAY